MQDKHINMYQYKVQIGDGEKNEFHFLKNRLASRVLKIKFKKLSFSNSSI